jgi:serine O-acetyltransferase
MAKDLYSRLIKGRSSRIWGRLSYGLLKLLGSEIPRRVQIGEGFELVHGGFGVVIHPDTVIGKRVKVYPGVTLGRADVYLTAVRSQFAGFIIEDDVILSPGAKILCKHGTLKVGKGTVIGANAVLLEPTGEMEIWAGVPARCIGKRPDLE